MVLCLSLIPPLYSTLWAVAPHPPSQWAGMTCKRVEVPALESDTFGSYPWLATYHDPQSTYYKMEAILPTS